METTKTLGFIITRHVTNKRIDEYWNMSYDSIRKFYPDNHIIIIDDNSNEEFVTTCELHNTTIIKSEYPGRGELLPYYYYLENKLFDIAVIIHDSVFVNKYIDEFNEVKTFKMFWHFKHFWDHVENESSILSVYKDQNLLNFHNNTSLWNGCFGGMGIISHDYLKSIDAQFPIKLLLPLILNRYNRMSFERIIGVLLQYNLGKIDSLLGDIHDYCAWELKIEQIEHVKHLPIIKVWTGR